MENFTLYQDKYGLYNEKPVIDGEPSGNDGPILTAYAEKLGLPLDREKLAAYWQALERKPIPDERLPGKKLPPPSRDTILGWYWLGFLSVDTLILHNWNFSPWPLPPRNFWKTLQALWRMRSSHRNALWMNGGEPYLWRYAFAVPLQDRAYLLRNSGKKILFRYWLAERIHFLINKSSISSRRIFWRKYE